MNRLAWLWLLLLAPSTPGKVVLDLTGPEEAHGTWKDSVTLPCMYEPSPDFLEQGVVWRQLDHHNRAIFRRDDDSGDQTPVAQYRDRLSVPEQPLGNVSLLIHSLDMADRGRYACEVSFLTKNNTRITVSRTITLKIKKVPLTKPVIKVTNDDDTNLPGVMRVNLTCLTSGSPPITYRWFKQVQGSNATLVGNEALLAFNRLEASDSAKYYCEVENTVSTEKQQSKPLQLSIQTPGTSTILGRITEFVMNTTAWTGTRMAFGEGNTSGNISPRELAVEKHPGTTLIVVTTTTTPATTTKKPSKTQGRKLSTFTIVLLALLSFIIISTLAVYVYQRRNDEGFPASLFCITRTEDAEAEAEDNASESDGLHSHEMGRNNRCACSYEYEALHGGADSSYILAPILGLEEEATELKTVKTYDALVCDADPNVLDDD